MEFANIPPRVATLSKWLLSKYAIAAPRLMPMPKVKRMEIDITNSVQGRDSARTRLTGSWYHSDCPRSP